MELREYQCPKCQGTFWVLSYPDDEVFHCPHQSTFQCIGAECPQTGRKIVFEDKEGLSPSGQEVG